jgi:SAM-dependent methyltransferase
MRTRGMRKRSSYSCGSPQVEPSQYVRPGYDYKGRFISYWHQIDEIVQQRPATTLEIGIGNGFVSSYLRERGYAVTTVDHDRRLGPDITASVLALPLQDGCFDVVACFEVLEHLPFESVPRALSELRRVSKRSVLISVPDVDRAYPFLITIPRLGAFRTLVSVPRLRPLQHHFDGQHYWEIGKAGYPLRRIEKLLEQSALKLARTFRPVEMPWHRFFILRCS